jgi:hypothetical protein
MLKANDPLIPGMDFIIGGEGYIAPPLNLGGIKAVLPRLSANSAEVVSIVLCVALKRNYPEVTQPWLDENMTGVEFLAASKQILDFLVMCGLREASPVQGEDPAAADAHLRSTGYGLWIYLRTDRQNDYGGLQRDLRLLARSSARPCSDCWLRWVQAMGHDK